VKSGAASPLPGYLLAQTGHTGHLIAVGLLALAGLALAVSLVVRPPRDCRSATWRLIIGLVLMFALAPASRFGYFIYPVGLWVWMQVSSLGARGASPELGSPEPGPHDRRSAPDPAVT
jgi:phosphatidylinositol alpha-1,6-mannosyltransferase